MTRIREATAETEGRAAELFGLYPHKAAQRIIQRMDRDKLNELYIAGLRGALAAGRPHWIVESMEDARGYDASGPAPLALAGLVPDAWHSEIYALRMGKIQPWLNTVAPGEGRALIETVLRRARADGFERLSIRIDGEDFPNLHLLEDAGFRLIDVSLKFSRPMPFEPALFPVERAGWSVRPSAPEDADWMAELGANAHAGTHYLNDPALSREGTRALFGQWVRKCAEKLAYRIYVLEREGLRAGFVVYLRNNSLRNAVGVNPIILDYVILDPARRGGGAGPWFVQETLRRESEAGFDFCELRTSTHNLPAVGLYEKTGFRACSTDFAMSIRL